MGRTFKEEASMPGRSWGDAVRYGLPGLLLGLVLASGIRGGGRELRAQVPGPNPAQGMLPGGGGYDRQRPAGTAGGEADGTIAFATNAGGPIQWLYLIDSKSRAFTIYRFDSTKGMVKLEAARQFGPDLKLTGYNNLDPQVTAVESMVRTTAPPPTR
jgi:hypothetical protein